MTNIVKDMSTLTTIPEKTLNKFFRKMSFCICETLAEDIQKEDIEISSMDIGIGTLYIKVVGDTAKYKFVPNDLLEKSIKQTIVNKENLLSDLLNDALGKKFMEVYKDLC